MLVFVPRRDRIRTSCAIARQRRFSACAGSVQLLQRPSDPAGAGVSERPFTRPQQRFRHHYEVNVPDLRLPRRTAHLSESVRSPAPSLHSVSRPIRGRDPRRETRFSRLFAALPQYWRHPLPFGSYRPSGSKRFDRCTAESSSCGTSGLNRSSRSTHRSVNPGTESMMTWRR